MISETINLFYNNENLVQAAKMKAYLRNQFEFLGLPKPQRVLLQKQFLKQEITHYLP